MATIITGIICFVVGAGMGVSVMALCFAASECDRNDEKLAKRIDEDNNKDEKTES